MYTSAGQIATIPDLKAEKRRQTAGPTIADVRRLLDATRGDSEAETRDYAIVLMRARLALTLVACAARGGLRRILANWRSVGLQPAPKHSRGSRTKVAFGFGLLRDRLRFRSRGLTQLLGLKGPPCLEAAPSSRRSYSPSSRF